MKMNQMLRCPCCNDNEHQNPPYHDQLMTQVVEECGAFRYVARYYFCPVLQEMYEDEQLVNEHESIIQELIRADGDKGEQTSSGSG